jgi:hypothetical protein
MPLIYSNPERYAVALEEGSEGTQGRDPRQMTLEELESVGHPPRPLREAIREKCLDCSGGSIKEIRLCTAVACALWPFRMNKNPFHTRKSTDES